MPNPPGDPVGHDHGPRAVTAMGHRIRGADALLQVLDRWGVRHVFTCPGSTEAAFLTAATEQDAVSVMLTTHESVAVAMADGAARETGRPAVAYLHANVGLTNGLSHLAAARLARSPVVVLTGLKQFAIQNRGGFTTSPNIREFVRQYTKWDWQTITPAAVAEDVNRALRVAASAPQGPTWVGLAQDVVEGESPEELPDPRRFAVSARRRPLRDDVLAAAEMLGRSPRVAIVAGAECAPHGVPALLDLADRLGAVLLAEDRRTIERSVVPADHPAYAGMYSATRRCVRESDVLFLAGTPSPMEFEAPAEPALPAGVPTIHLHSDAAEVGKLYGVDIALVGDAEATLAELAESVPARPRTKETTAYLLAAREEHRANREKSIGDPAGPGDSLSVGDVMHTLATTFDAETTVVGDATTSGGALLHALERAPRARFHTTSSGSLGWGAGFALGVQLADPTRRVIAVLGDGVFQFGLPALWTATRYALPVVFVVVNNQSYAAVGAAIRRYAGGLTARERDMTVDLAGPDLAAVARGFGADAHRVTTAHDLARCIDNARGRKGPTVIEVMTDPTDLGP